MPRKPLTDEQREKRRESLAKAREARKLKRESQDVNTNGDSSSNHSFVDSQNVGNPVTQSPTVTLTQEQFQLMLDRLAARPEVQASPQAVNQAFGDTPRLNAQGGVVGVIERFPIDPAFYKNPVEELYDLSELRRFGVRENYVIEWRVTPTRYQSAMGTWYIEPRFELVLKRKQFDPETNEELVKYDDNGKPYNPRIVLGRASFFEDPPANMLEAEEAGVSVEDLDKPEFQEKMRMYRYKFWLIEQLTPRPPRYTTSHSTEQVIGGRVYEIDEYSNPV